MALSVSGTQYMKARAWCMAVVLVTGAPCWAAGATQKVEELRGLPRQEPAAESGMTCYMPYAASRDHMVTGCEVPGYRMQFELAKSWGMFMVLLPDGATVENARVYFAVATPELRGQPLRKLFEDDLKGLQAARPGTRVVKHLHHTLPLKLGSGGRGGAPDKAMKDLGGCEGVSVVYPAQNSRFPYETYFICKAGSKRYALLLSLSAVTQPDMEAAMADFLKWMDVPQTVRDVEGGRLP
jgi:hypothetical protein